MQYELRVSGPGCTEDALLLVFVELAVEATVTRSATVMGDGVVEPGATVHLHRCTEEAFRSKIWPALTRVFSFSCAYLSVFDRGFHGCVLDFLRPTACPLRGASSVLADGLLPRRSPSPSSRRCATEADAPVVWGSCDDV